MVVSAQVQTLVTQRGPVASTTSPPSGAALNPTRIIGQNAGSCTSQHTGLVNPTILSGIAGAFAVLDIAGDQLSPAFRASRLQPDNCTQSGQGSGGGCGDMANFVAVAGIVFEYGNIAQGPSNLTMQDIATDGIAGCGILGSHVNTTSTDVLTASDIYMIGNGGPDGTATVEAALRPANQ